MATIIFRAGFPREVERSVRRHIKAHQALIPSWCHELEVIWDTQDEAGNIASVRPQLEYRRGNLFICPLWLSETEEQRDAAIVHEIAHLVAEPLQGYARTLLNHVMDGDDGMTPWAVEEFRKAMESTVCDIQHAWSTVHHAK